MKECVDVINFKRKNKKEICRFPDDSVVKNPPANARNQGLLPDPGTFHMTQSSQACVPRLLSLCSRVGRHKF